MVLFLNKRAEQIPEVPAFDIEELSGQFRRIRLRGRALPYQDVPFITKQRTKLTWYPGNPVATLQVLGPEHGTTKINGIWKDRFLLDQVDARGFDAIGKLNTAEKLVAAIRDIQLSGSDLRVQWGPEVRFGIIANFDATWVRVQDCKWDVEFVWSGSEQTQPRAQAPERVSTNTMRKTLVNLDDDFVLDPFSVARKYQSALLTIIDNGRAAVTSVFDAVRNVQSQVLFPITAIRAAGTACEQVRNEMTDLVNGIVDIPYTAKSTVDFVVNVLDVETWSRTVALRARQQRAAAQQQALDLAKKAVPEAVQVITVPGDTTLRQLAITYYGNADDWQAIADVNGLVGSVVPAGTVLIITSKPTANSQVV